MDKVETSGNNSV